MKLNREIHNFREWTDSQGVIKREIIIDITSDDIDHAGSYGAHHLCFVTGDVSIDASKNVVRIPITIPLEGDIFTMAKITRIRRNYLLINGGLYADLDLLYPFLTSNQYQEIMRAIAKATKIYKDQLPDKPDENEIRRQEKRARIEARIKAVTEAQLDSVITQIGAV